MTCSSVVLSFRGLGDFERVSLLPDVAAWFRRQHIVASFPFHAEIGEHLTTSTFARRLAAESTTGLSASQQQSLRCSSRPAAYQRSQEVEA